MNSYAITCCSLADLPASLLDSLGVTYLPFHYHLDATPFDDDLFATIPAESFYKALKDGATPSVSSVTIDEFEAFFASFLEAGQDVLHIASSSGFSGACHAAKIASEFLKEQYPERTVTVVDSLAISSGYGLLVKNAAALRQKGKSLSEVAAYLEEAKSSVLHLFILRNASFYTKGKKRGGLLLTLDEQGKLVFCGKLRRKKKLNSLILDKISPYFEGGEAASCTLAHGDCYGDARTLADFLEDAFPRVKGELSIASIGSTVGAYTGPFALGVFALKGI